MQSTSEELSDFHILELPITKHGKNTLMVYTRRKKEEVLKDIAFTIGLSDKVEVVKDEPLMESLDG